MDKKKKIKYIKIREEELKRPAKKRKSNAMKNVGSALTIIGTTFASMLLILVIALCIVLTVLTVYVLDFADTGYDLNLRDAEMKSTSIIYAYDSDGAEVEIKRLVASENRIWVNYEDISPNIVNAVVSTEDKRFYEHDGVDWQRTVFSLGADVLNLSSAGQGGSTITQQLVKNLTGDDEISWERKLREIFRAMSIEEKYTKIDIIESYLNEIWFGGNIHGVGAASKYYFNKEPKDLTIAESAILAGMIRNPGKMNPYYDLARCKTRQKYALNNMYEQGYITTAEYETALVEQVHFAKPVYGDDFGYIDERTLNTDDEEEDTTAEETYDETYEAYKWNDYTITQNWYVDAAIDQVLNDYADEKGITYTAAKNEIYNGGYKIYLNMDIDLQNTLEEKYRDPYTVLSKYDPTAPSEDLIQSAFVVMDYTGTVVGLVGGLGDKPGDGVFNRATQAMRAPGSTMKPISTYSVAVQRDLITYSTLIPDRGITVVNDSGTGTKIWPENYQQAGGLGTLTPVWEGVRESMNTIAIRVSRMLTPQVCYNQLTQNLGFTTITESDIAYSPITLGALTKGVKLVELAAAYQIFGNGGIYYEPMLYSRVVDSRDNVVLDQDFFGTQALDSDAAWVTNRLLRTVITTTTGTGRYAQLENVDVIGKTGTSNDGKNLMFVGCTPDYIGALWIGYDDGREIGRSDGWKALAKIWNDIMKEVQDTSQVRNFTPDSSVLERRYCLETGLLASSKCTKTDIGYYRQSNVPDFCTGDHKKIRQQIVDDWNAIDEEDAAKVRAYVEALNS